MRKRECHPHRGANRGLIAREVDEAVYLEVDAVPPRDDRSTRWDTPHRIGVVFELAIGTGMRGGGLTELRWSGVDLERACLVVRQQRVQVSRTMVEGCVKTDEGQDRRISIGSESVAALLAWQLQQSEGRSTWGDAWTDTVHFFTYEDGAPLRPAYVSRVFNVLVEQAGLPHPSLHGLRNQHASLLIAQGVPMPVVSKRLGYSTITITVDHYGHLLEGPHRRAADMVEAALRPRTRSAHIPLTHPANPGVTTAA